ncbi:exodeoxyribonuclease V subunit gamma [Pararcticibacter amylolyticus]|uniref:RecBCD enzyme subunit RecC n=1 Tax=Pararcticibacter amylolyticus TaxID=2173175 RepID=A0A2U2PAS1_9SPHI|nr:exodeoxyribonuclease V subunit gamma [Pararcticibacter amylolyticus]PWG78501.1 exodeoxyribonuclease V subunit gamma [Pararcticibacter amylolyticus]
MALYLQVSNSLSQLAKRLCTNLQSQSNEVFQPYYIITQTEGMNNWLKIQMAECMGIAANYRFLKPNDIIFEVYQLLGGKYSRTMSPEHLSWIFYRILNDREFLSAFPDIAAYYQHGSDREVKRFALAAKVADLIDQYQIYRPEMIGEWNESAPGDVRSGEWQKYLWTRARLLMQDNIPDRTLMGQYILQAIRKGQNTNALQARMPGIHIFGLSVITSYHLSLFSALSPYVDFYFYILNPAPSEYWFEDRTERQLAFLKKKGLVPADQEASGNPLLTSWGRLIQNTFSLFFQHDELINSYEEAKTEEPGDASLLQCLQQDIFYNRDHTERKRLSVEQLTDGSVTINACYTPAREVEALYNYLVYLIDQKKEKLSARDVVVMVTDIDTYAPYIRAVFNNAPYIFPYTIADESFAASDSITNALQAVLKISRQNFKAEEVLQLLDSAYIRKRFGITDTALLRKVTGRANIRFGMDGDRDDDTVYVSWKYGMERIMYSLCIGGQEEFVDEKGESYYPLDLVEGHASSEIIRFYHFIEVLIDAVKERDRHRTVQEWVSYVEAVLMNLIFESGEEPDEDHAALLKELEKYNELNGVVTEPVSYEVFSHSFIGRLSSISRSSSFIAGGITFCSLIPMRSIPFRVVALLGLNYDKFPRKENPVGFSLMEKEKRKGDRNIKENDKHLFLETLLSARDYFYISYIGQNVKDNTVLPPSALVDELIDYIEAGIEETERHSVSLTTRQPLHSFSTKYKTGDPRLYNYLDAVPEEITNDVLVKKDPGATLSDVSADSFIAFFRNPFKGYYHDVLGVYYRTEDILLSDTEIFDLGGLEKWQLKQVLLHHDTDAVSGLKEKLVKTGGLPLKNMAGIALESAELEVSPVRKLMREFTDGVKESVPEIEVLLDSITVRGTLPGVYGDKLVYVSWSKSEGKYLQDAYLRYLLARAGGVADEVYFISAHKNIACRGTHLTKEEAIRRLNELVLLYIQGHEEILAWYPDFEIQPQKIVQLTDDDLMNVAEKKLNSYSIPCNDPYILKEYGKGFFQREGISERYKNAAAYLLAPLTEIFPEYFK